METESNDPSLDLKLCNDHEGGGGDGLKQSSPAASQSSNEAEAELPIEGERKNYYCKYCNKRFSNSQALGGHQNAHKRERSMAKKDKGLQEAALAAIESRLHPFSTVNSTFGSPLGVQRQSFIRKPFNFDYYAGIGYDNYIGGGDSSSGYSNHYRPFPIMNGTTNYRYAIQKPPNMNSYWDGDAGYQSRPRPQATAKPFNVGGYQAALPARVSNVCGPTVNQPSFAWPVGASNSVNDKISGAYHGPSSGQLLFQRHEAEVRVPTTEKQIAPAIDLTLKL